MRLVRTYVRTILFVFLAALGWAQQPFVPIVTDTPGAPSMVLFGAYNGALVRSLDAGVTWLPVYVTEPGLPQPPIQGFAIDAVNSTTLYLATTIAAGAFWKSTDGGVTWAKAANGLPKTGPGVDFFQYVFDSSPFLYLKAGNQFFRSADSGTTWVLQGNLPGSAGRVQVADTRRAWMYYVEPSTLVVWFSGDEGHSWQRVGLIPADITNTVVTGMGILYFNPSGVFVTLDGLGAAGPWVSLDAGGTFTDATTVGLGNFTKILSFNTGPTYALTPNYMGTFRSLDSAQSWQSIGATGDHYGITAVDPGIRTTVFGVKSSVTTGVRASLVTSADGGNTWNPIPSTITPTIAKPASIFNVTLEEGAPYSVAFTVQTYEDPAWKTPVSVTSSGETWLQIGSASGTTPLANSITINTTGLAPGSYTSTLIVSAPQSNNKSVSVPVKLTVRPLGSLGPGYLVSTIAGSGQTTDIHTSGTATTLGIGAPKALAFDASGNVLISAGSRLWQFSTGTLTALAGNGVNASTGDGNDPLSASISDPDAIALDSTGTIYLSEYVPERVRKLTGGNINTALDMTRTRVIQTVGSHSLLLDPTNRFLLTGPGGLLRYDGLLLSLVTNASFSDPYAMVADASGNLYVSDRALHQIFEITPGSVVSVVAGTGLPGFSGDGGPALQATLNTPEGMAFDSQGTLYIADSGNHRIRAIGPDGTIRTIAGSGIPGFAGDGSTSDFASFLNPTAVLVDANGNIYVADTGNNRIRSLAPQAVPAPKPGALVNGPSSATKLSPGGVFSLYGTLLASTGVAAAAPTPAWPRSLAGVSVTINGVLAPLSYVSPLQINGQVPFETALGTATAMITSNGSPAAQITFPVVAAEPAIITPSGSMQAVALNQNGTYNSPATPAAPGDVEVLALTGIGQTNPPASTGAPAPSTQPLDKVNYQYQITLNGAPVTVYYLGLAPGWTGLVQANFQIPSSLANGDYPLVATVNGESSVPAVLSVRK